MFNSNGQNLVKVLCRFVSSRRVKGDFQIPDAKKIAEPWNERKGVWKSAFRHFQPETPYFGPDAVRFMQTPIDFSPSNVKKWYENKIEAQEDIHQAFDPDRYKILGPDLACAHFIVHRGGSVRFQGDKEWTTCREDKTYTLPTQYVGGLFVEAIDCNGMSLRHSGLENILDLERLRWLSFANNPLVDDWTMDSISGSYGKTLQYLDLSNCSKISHRALSCFYRFEKLDTLVVSGLEHTDEFKLSCMMLEDIKPMLTIKGLEHSSPEK